MTRVDICGVLVKARTDRLPGVHKTLQEIPGVEVHAVTDQGQLLVILEGTAERSTVDTMASLFDVEGVLATSLVYEYSDFAETQKESAS